MYQKFFKFENMHYMLTYPDEYKEGEAYPILFLIHGSGTRGNNPYLLMDSVFYLNIRKIENFPFIVVAPLCHENTWFDMYETLKRFILYISECDFADKNRVYAMGISMGGYALWQLGMSMPETFAAIAPICGGGMYWNAERLKNVPVWAFHGAKDPVVYVEESQKMVDRINETGGNARLTILPDVEHNAWDGAYGNRELYEWFLSHKNENTKTINNIFNDSNIYG